MGPLVQKIWCFEVGHSPSISQTDQKINPHVSETDHPITEKFQIWGLGAETNMMYAKFH